MKTWYQHLGFKENPLTIKPVHRVEQFESYKEVLKRLTTTISQGNIIYLEGQYGTGKTTLLNKIIKIYGGDKRIIYYNSSRAENILDIDHLITNRTFWSRLFRFKSKNLLLLLDEAQHLTEEDAKNILKHFNEGYFHSAILVAKTRRDLPDAINNVLGSNIFKTDSLTENEAITLIKSRLNNLDVINEDQILKIYEASNRNPRRLLINTEEICRLALKTDTKIQDKHIEQILN
tara:strand:- start:9106 stop:9804 length:699 start_codon:yes stop_codon:yes gene_type:complete